MHHERFLREWREFTSFASVSADPAFHEHCVACAEWVSNRLQGLGFQTEIWESSTKPLVHGIRLYRRQRAVFHPLPVGFTGHESQ